AKHHARRPGQGHREVVAGSVRVVANVVPRWKLFDHVKLARPTEPHHDVAASDLSGSHGHLFSSGTAAMIRSSASRSGSRLTDFVPFFHAPRSVGAFVYRSISAARTSCASSSSVIRPPP